MRRSTGLQRPVRWCGTLGGAAFHEPVYQVARPQSAHGAQRFQCILPVSLLVFFLVVVQHKITVRGHLEGRLPVARHVGRWARALQLAPHCDCRRR